MNKTIANFLTQPNKDFPLDCETLHCMQMNGSIHEILGNIGGDKIILLGCEQANNNTTRNEGYVFLRTIDFPKGEVMYFEGGSTVNGMYVKLTDVAINTMGYSYPKAYTKRSLAAGIGTENYSWNDFTSLATVKDLNSRLNNLAIRVDTLAGEPCGIVKIWAGKNTPNGYALCDGRELNINDYPELYGALGNTFNNAMSPSGEQYATTANHFRLPDLRGRFIVGYHDTDIEYQKISSVGGEKKHIITESEMPKHSHNIDDLYFVESSNALESATYKKTIKDYNHNVGSGDRDWDNDTYLYNTHPTEAVGGGISHENRPPYYVLSYIIKLI